MVLCRKNIVSPTHRSSELFDHIGRDLDRSKQMDVLYLDMSKAFDKVRHIKLLDCLSEFEFGGRILK